MYKYKQYEPLSIIKAVAQEMVRYCCRDLEIPEPNILYMREIKEGDTSPVVIQHNDDILGVSSAPKGQPAVIYLHVYAGLEINTLMNTAAHEVFHLYEHYKFGVSSERKAKQYGRIAAFAILNGMKSPREFMKREGIV